MAPTDRAARLQTEAHAAIHKNLEAFQVQRKAAIQAGDLAALASIEAHIGRLHRQEKDLSFLGLQALEDSDELREAIAELKKSAKALNDEADNIVTVAAALEKGAEIVDLGAKIVSKLREFAPV